MSIRRLVNVMEYVIKSNARNEAEKLRVMNELYADDDGKQTTSTGRPRRSGRDKIAQYANKQRGQVAPVSAPTVPEPTVPAARPKRRQKTGPPPGFGMSLEAAQALMKSAEEEDRELSRARRGRSS